MYVKMVVWVMDMVRAGMNDSAVANPFGEQVKGETSTHDNFIGK